MGIMLIIAVIAVVVIVFFVMRFMRNVQPEEEAVNEDVQMLKAMLAEWKGGFMDWSLSEMDQLSTAQIGQAVEAGTTPVGQGVFVSLDNTPMFAYAFKRYIGPGVNGVIYAMTNQHEWVFKFDTKGATTTLNGQKIGLIRRDSTLYDLRNQPIAAAKNNALNGTRQLNIGNKEVAQFNAQHAATETDTRALQMPATLPTLSTSEAALFQTLTIFELTHPLLEAARS